MKKIISFMLFLMFVFTLTGCGTKNAENKNPMSGINAEVEKKEGAKETVYTFKEHLTTTLPNGISAKDQSTNGDFALFAFSDDVQTCLDITFYYDKKATDADMQKKAKELAQNGNSSPKETIYIDEIPFYGINTPDYGLIRYIGAVDGIETSIAVYVEEDAPVVKAFIENTVFSTE